MLVRAFEIEIGGPSELRPLFEHKGVGRARIEPYLDDIRDLLPLAGVVSVAKKFGRIGREPDICSRLLDRGSDSFDDNWVAQRLTGFAVSKHCNRHAPGTL